MQTVYILKNCLKSYKALILLYKNPDISTNIIVVDKFYYKVLKLDKRVTRFPFIINTAPTNTGLIPSVAKVLPLDLFINLTDEQDKPRKVEKKHGIDNHNISSNDYRRRQILNNYRQKIKSRPTRGVPIIRKTSDGGVNIVLN